MPPGRRKLGEFDEHKTKMSTAIEEFREALSLEQGKSSLVFHHQQLRRHTKGNLIAGGGELLFVNAFATMRVRFNGLILGA